MDKERVFDNDKIEEARKKLEDSVARKGYKLIDKRGKFNPKRSMILQFKRWIKGVKNG